MNARRVLTAGSAVVIALAMAGAGSAFAATGPAHHEADHKAAHHKVVHKKDMHKKAMTSSAKGELQIFSWWTGVASSKALAALVHVFNEQYPHIKVINEAVAGGAGSNAKAVLVSR
ncbi:MAG: carbohydrate ABC transporter substrate-binding protein, partial [Firmicutes bacterium]|nr:carbohydrate ABC transporter substrate-binding protein [Bacillota bacterium]